MPEKKSTQKEVKPKGFRIVFEDDAEIRNYVKTLIVGQVKTILKDQLDELVKNAISEKMKHYMDSILEKKLKTDLTAMIDAEIRVTFKNMDLQQTIKDTILSELATRPYSGSDDTLLDSFITKCVKDAVMERFKYFDPKEETSNKIKQ
jgi:hypothetical protein